MIEEKRRLLSCVCQQTCFGFRQATTLAAPAARCITESQNMATDEGSSSSQESSSLNDDETSSQSSGSDIRSRDPGSGVLVSGR